MNTNYKAKWPDIFENMSEPLQDSLEGKLQLSENMGHTYTYEQARLLAQVFRRDITRNEFHARVLELVKGKKS